MAKTGISSVSNEIVWLCSLGLALCENFRRLSGRTGGRLERGVDGWRELHRYGISSWIEFFVACDCHDAEKQTLFLSDNRALYSFSTTYSIVRP